MAAIFKYCFSILLLFLFCIQTSRAQSVNLDSLRAAQQHRTDSIRTVQKHRSDSLKVIRTYRSSKSYKDSVAAFRQHRLDSMKAFRENVQDSMMRVRKHTNDSLVAIRRHYNDSLKTSIDSIRLARQHQLDLLKAQRKVIADSLGAIRAYRSSKGYKDSLAVIRQHRKDSMIAARKHVSDSLRAIQQAKTDSMKAVRQAFNDSLHAALDSMKLVRQHQQDSMAVLRQARKDSLAKVQADREVLRGEKHKEQEKKKQLAFEMKVKKKQGAYTNEKMRKKKWSVPRKIVQNTFTHYNYYFNADKKMDEAIDNMLRSRQDNYDSLIPIFPFNPDQDSAKLGSDMDTIISKASVGIQIHDPRAKWQDDLYLLVGEAYFYKADYENATAAFKLIVAQAERDKKEKAKRQGSGREDRGKPVSYSEEEKTGLAGALAHVPAKNEAMLWLARTFTQGKKEGQAQTLIDMLQNDAQFPERLKGRLSLEQAFVNLSREDYKGAVNALAVVSADHGMPDWLRLRASFLSGQLLQQQGHLADANKAFEQTISLHPALDMEFYARKNIAFNNLNGTGDAGTTKDFLADMAKEGKYRQFYDQIYFMLGRAELKENNQDLAMQDFRKSIQLSQNNKKQKGLTFAAMGDEYYKQRDYRNAKLTYDSAAMFLTPAEDPVYSLASQRSQALDQIVAPALAMKEQDSLIQLAALSEEEQRAVIRKYLHDLEKQRSDSAFLAQNKTSGTTTTNLFNNMSSQSWYFTNTSQMQQGKNEFLQKWGNRPLADDWRRNAKFALVDNNAGGAENQNAAKSLPDPDSLFAAIPHGEAQLAAAREKLQEAIFHLGKGYYTYLEDYPNASGTFDTLDRRFPSHPHQAEVLYTRYLMAMRQNQPAVAEQYNAALQSRFSESEWAKLLRQARNESPVPGSAGATDTETVAGQRLSDYYDETYDLLEQSRYEEVITRSDGAAKIYPVLGDFHRKFVLMSAIATAGLGRYPEADSMLTSFIKRDATDSLGAWANEVLNFIRRQGKETPQNAGSNAHDTISSGTETEPGNKALTASYTFEPRSPHHVIVVADADMRIFALKSGILDFNLMRPGKENEEISITMTTLNPGNNIIICRGFNDGASALLYLKELKKNRNLFREYPKQDYSLLIISEENYAILMTQKNFAVYKKFYEKYYK